MAQPSVLNSRVRRWLLNISAGLSLLLMLAVVTLWVRSYLVSDWMTRWDVHTEDYVVIGLWSECGIIQLCRTRAPLWELPDAVSHWWWDCFKPAWSKERFEIAWKPDRRMLWVPHWALLPPLMIAPALWFRRWRRERRTRGGGFVARKSPSHPKKSSSRATDK